jgi:hypothetical protein
MTGQQRDKRPKAEQAPEAVAEQKAAGFEEFWREVHALQRQVVNDICILCPPFLYENSDFRDYACPFKSLLPFCPNQDE